MAQRTMQVENRLRNGDAVVASGRTHRDVIAAAVAKRLEVLSEKEVKKLIDAICARLELAGNVLGVAEDQHVAEQADDVVPRQARDAAMQNLLGLYARVRNRVENALGDPGLARYGLDGATPRTASGLASRMESSIKLMRRDPAVLDDGLGDPVSTTKLATNLAAALAPLTAALESLRTEERENEAALTDRDRALGEWTGVYQGVATLLSGLYRLAGRDDLADRIRPTERRASGLETPPPELTVPAHPAGDPGLVEGEGGPDGEEHT